MQDREETSSQQQPDAGQDVDEKATGRSDQRLGNSSSDQTLDQTLVANRLDAGQQRPIEYREVPERRKCDRTRWWHVTGRWQRPISGSRL